MQIAKVSEYRNQLAKLHLKVLQDHDPLRVSGKEGDVVIIAADDYENLLETIHVLKDEVTMASLLENRKQVAAKIVQGAEVKEVFSDFLVP